MKDYFKITPRIIAHLGEDLIKNEIFENHEIYFNNLFASMKYSSSLSIASSKGTAYFFITPSSYASSLLNV